ncbi:MAG: eL32 family ribosomal protein [Nanoarchaeota archaeon]
MIGRKFLRQDSVRHVRLGKNRPKLQKWRRPRGMHSKIRKKRFGYPLFPMTGFKKNANDSGKIHGLLPKVVYSKSDFEDVNSGHLVIFSRKIGAKKRIELVKEAQTRKFKIFEGRGKRNEA